MTRIHVKPAQHDSLSPIERRRKWAARTLQLAQEQGGMTLLIEGQAGMGKTFLLRELRSAALADGQWHLTIVRADEFEVGEPYSFIERLVAASQIEDWYFESGSLSDPIAVARECIRRLVMEGDSTGQIFLVDDAQWIDPDSLRVLRYVIPRIARRNTLLAFGARSPHAPGSFGEFLSEIVVDSHLDHLLHLEPLDAQDVSALIAERFSLVVPAAVVQKLVDESDGSFLQIDTLLSLMTTKDIEQLQSGWQPPKHVTKGLSDPLLLQFSELDRETQATIELVSAAAHELTVSQVDAAASILNEPNRLEEATATGLVSAAQTNGLILTRHALFAEAVTGSLAPERARALYRALAEVTDGYRSLRHRLMGADGWSDQLHKEVRAYVSVAIDERRYGSASEVLRAALTLVTEPDARIELIETLVLLRLQARDGALPVELVEELASAPPTLLRHLLVQVLSAQRLKAEISPTAVREVLVTEPKNPDEHAILAFYAFMVVMLSMRSPDTSGVSTLIDHTKAIVAASPRTREELTDQRLGWMVERENRLLLLDCYEMVQCQQRREFAEVAAAIPGLVQRIELAEDTPTKVDAMVAVAGGQVAIGKLDEAYGTAQRSVELLERVGEPWASGTVRVILGHCMVMHGELHEATELIELMDAVSQNSLDVEVRTSWAALRLHTAAIMGNEDAELYLDAARRHREIGWEGYSPDLGVIAECELARVRGDMDAVLRVTDKKLVNKYRGTQRGYLTYRALALIETEQLQDARTLIGKLAKWRGTRWQEYWGTLDWLSARLAEAEGDAQTAKWHYESAMRRLEYPLQYGLALADYGRFLRRRGDQTQGQRKLEAALTLLEDMGAEGYAAIVRKDRDSSADAQTSSPEVERLLSLLTDRERQVVAQLVRGRSNPQIADSLVVSIATVRSHISNILRKLQLSSRAEVARVLGESLA